MTRKERPKVTLLADGVGAARLLRGLVSLVDPDHLTVVVNTGDDFEHLGLNVSPDLDTVCYTLAGLANPETGWGFSDESWRVLETLGNLGGPDWFRLGDADLATHLERTRRLRLGQTLTEITRDFCRSWSVGPDVLPMSDDPAPTFVLTVYGYPGSQQAGEHLQTAVDQQGNYEEIHANHESSENQSCFAAGW